ncbi:PAS domain S-box protein [Solibacillus sp. FSL W7-1472]|uniref:PAS domain-containing protein n=1 Tax=Solibacillus sp. FSL W7-1472 TaxID=2921707 RepID=UPI0030DB47F1
MSELKSNRSIMQELALSQFPKELIERVFENIAEGIMITDRYRRILSINVAFEFVTGFKLEEVQGEKPSILQSGVHDRAFYIDMWKQIGKTGIWQGEIWNRRKTGELYPEWLTILAIKDEAGKITNYCGIFTDLSERKIVEDELEKKISS